MWVFLILIYDILYVSRWICVGLRLKPLLVVAVLGVDRLRSLINHCSSSRSLLGIWICCSLYIKTKWWYADHMFDVLFMGYNIANQWLYNIYLIVNTFILYSVQFHVDLVIASPYIFQVPLVSDAKFVLLASDGLWD